MAWAWTSALTDRIPPSTQLTLISFGPSLTIGPRRLWASHTVTFSLPQYLIHSIQMAEKADVGWASGILDSGEFAIELEI